MSAHTTHHPQLTCLDLDDPFGWGRRQSVDRGAASPAAPGPARASTRDSDVAWPRRVAWPGSR